MTDLQYDALLAFQRKMHARLAIGVAVLSTLAVVASLV